MYFSSVLLILLVFSFWGCWCIRHNVVMTLSCTHLERTRWWWWVWFIRWRRWPCWWHSPLTWLVRISTSTYYEKHLFKCIQRCVLGMSLNGKCFVNPLPYLQVDTPMWSVRQSANQWKALHCRYLLHARYGGRSIMLMDYRISYLQVGGLEALEEVWSLI